MIVFLNEENSELKGKMFPLPEGVLKHLKNVLKKYENEDGNKNNKGYDHLKWITSQTKISTEEMKRIKNFFDNYKGTEESDDYKLYGGKQMFDWVSATLKQASRVSKENKPRLFLLFIAVFIVGCRIFYILKQNRKIFRSSKTFPLLKCSKKRILC